MVIGALHGFKNFGFCCTVKHWSHRLETKNLGGPSKMGLKNLAHVHAAWYAEWIQQHFHWSSVIHERHIFFRHDAGNNALVSVTSGHFVAD